MKFKGMEKVWDLMVLNVLFLLCSLPVVTIGPAATAMHYALRRWREQQGEIVKDFFRSFRQNFRQGLILWLVFLALGALIGWNFWLISNWTGMLYSVLMVVLLLAAYLLLVWVSMVFPLLARFENTTPRMAKNALLLALASPLRSFAAAALNVLPFLLAAVLPELFMVVSAAWLLLLCGVSGFLVQLLFAPVFDRIGIARAHEGSG